VTPGHDNRRYIAENHKEEGGMPIEGFGPYGPEDIERYVKHRWWLGITWGDMFDKATDFYPEKEALVDDTALFTYQELRERVARLAIGFMGLFHFYFMSALIIQGHATMEPTLFLSCSSSRKDDSRWFSNPSILSNTLLWNAFSRRSSHMCSTGFSSGA